jgi:hypothetical protein
MPKRLRGRRTEGAGDRCEESAANGLIYRAACGGECRKRSFAVARLVWLASFAPGASCDGAGTRCVRSPQGLINRRNLK